MTDRVIAMSLALVCSLAARPARAGQPVFISRDELRIVSGRWTHYNGYMGRIPPQQASVSGVFALPGKLPPGEYTAFVRGMNFGTVDVQLSCGGGQSPRVTPRGGDWSGLWSAPMPLTLREASDRVTVTVLRRPRSAADGRFLFQGLYITEAKGIVVDRSGYAVRLAGAEPAQTSAPAAANLLPNGGFEIGMGRGWGLAGGSREGRDFSIASLWSPTGGRYGAACVRLPPWTGLISRLIHVRPGRKHTFSLWAYSGVDGARLDLRLANAHQLPKEIGRVTSLRRSFGLKRGWQRLVLSGVLTGIPAAEYHVRVTTRDDAVRIDGLQLEEGDAGDYRPNAAMQVGLVSGRPGNVFCDGQPVGMRLRAYNGSDRPRDATVSYEVYDILNRPVKTGRLSVHAEAGATWEGGVDLTTGKRGIFRAVLWTDLDDGAEEEVAWCVVPPARSAKEQQDPDSIFGVHANPSGFSLGVLRTLGIRWQRVLSPAAWFRWQLVEPTKGRYVWHDEAARKTVAHGFTILGCVHGIPSWARRGEGPDPDEWERYVQAIVTHYKPWVKWWEVWNEPIHELKPQTYAELLQRAGRAIRKADPQAKIVGMGGSYSCDWCLKVIARLGGKPSDYMDVLSTHLYPANADPMNPRDARAAGEFHDKVIVPYGLPVWNTETGAWCQGFYKGPNASFARPGEPVAPFRDGWRFYRGCTREAERVACNFLHSIGNGFSRYFYYDSRFHAMPDYHRSHCTILDYDDSIRAKGVAYAVLANVFDRAVGLGNASPSRKAFAYIFQRRGVPLAAVWSADTRPKHLALALPARQIQVLDMMGNPVAFGGRVLPFGRQAVYLVGQEGLTVKAVRAALAAAKVTDTADRTPPNPSICQAPRGVIRPGPLRIRWIAIDETSIPGDQAPRAILYSFRLVGRTDAWSQWTARTIAEYRNLPAGSYRFELKARDEAGNVSPACVRAFRVRSIPQTGGQRVRGSE